MIKTIIIHSHKTMEHLRILFEKSEVQNSSEISNCFPVLDKINSCLNGDDILLISYVNGMKLAVSRSSYYNSAQKSGSIEMMLVLGLLKGKLSAPIIASKYGKLDFIKWILSKGVPWIDGTINGKDIISQASQYGQTHILDYMFKKGYSTSQDLIFALIGDQEESLKWIFENKTSIDFTDWSKYVRSIECLKIITSKIRLTNSDFLNLSSRNLLSCLKYACSKVDCWESGSCILRSCSSGSLEVFKWIIENEYQDWDKLYSVIACETNNIEILKWAHHKNFEFDEDLAISCLRTGYIGILDWLETINYNLKKESINPIFHCLKMTSINWYANNCEIDEETFISLLRSMPSKVIELFIPKIEQMKISYMRIASFRGDLDIIKVLKENNCPWDESVIRACLEYDHADCFQYIYENGCPISEYDIKVYCREHIDWSSSGTIFVLPSACEDYINSPRFHLSKKIRNSVLNRPDEISKLHRKR